MPQIPDFSKTPVVATFVYFTSGETRFISLADLFPGQNTDPESACVDVPSTGHLRLQLIWPWHLDSALKTPYQKANSPKYAIRLTRRRYGIPAWQKALNMARPGYEKILLTSVIPGVYSAPVKELFCQSHMST